MTVPAGAVYIGGVACTPDGAVYVTPTGTAALTGGTSAWNDGSAAAPSISRAAESDNGLWWPGTNTMAWVSGSGSIYFETNNNIGKLSGRTNDGSTSSWAISDAGDVTFSLAGAKSLFLTAPRHVAFGSAALATNATAGFMSIPSSAGLQTGVPANIPTGQCPLVYDSTNNKLMVYNGAWRSSAALT